MPFGWCDKQKIAVSNDKKLMVNKRRCSQNHPCPAVWACPTKALSQMNYEAPVVDVQKCTGCGHCISACPLGALSLL